MVASDHGAGLKQAKELGENFTWLGGTLIGAFREAANNLSAEIDWLYMHNRGQRIAVKPCSCHSQPVQDWSAVDQRTVICSA